MSRTKQQLTKTEKDIKTIQGNAVEITKQHGDVLI